jgi:hypothetical protein
MLSVKTVVGGSIIAGGLAIAGSGLVPVANATPSAPAIAGPQYFAENGPGRGHGHGHDDDWGWDDRGPRRWDPVDACIGIQGPFGYVSGSACI